MRFTRLFAAFALAALCHAQEVASRMDEVVRRFNFMGSVLVARGDQVLFSKSYGYANLEWKIPNSPSTKFRLGSITKQFTAACILLLEERGKLKTGDLVKKYLPGAPAAWDKMTIYNVLTHTAGIPDLTRFPDFPSIQVLPNAPEKLVELFLNKPLDFQPGEKFQYSNSGFILLGYLIEKVSGETYQEFLQRNILTPLHMNDSGYDSNSAIIPQRAAGYSPGPGGMVNARYVHMSVPFAAGALYSTTEDLLRWERGLFGGKVLSPASLKKMTTPFKNNYACGLMVNAVNGHKVIEHGGSIEGFNAVLAYYPDEKMTVVVLANLNGPAGHEISVKLAPIARGEAVAEQAERKEITVSPKIMERYVGTYAMDPGHDNVITLEDSRLMTQMTGQPKQQLFAESETMFFLKDVDAEVEFVKDALVVHQNGREMRAPRH